MIGVWKSITHWTRVRKGKVNIMEDMTLKEFKETLNAAGIPLDFWKWEGILNKISLYCYYKAGQFNTEGEKCARDAYMKSAETIHDVLADRGYYGD